MYTMQPKKLIIMNIIDILKCYPDENHHLSQREIHNILERNPIEFGYDVNCCENLRIFKEKVV